MEIFDYDRLIYHCVHVSAAGGRMGESFQCEWLWKRTKINGSNNGHCPQRMTEWWIALFRGNHLIRDNRETPQTNSHLRIWNHSPRARLKTGTDHKFNYSEIKLFVYKNNLYFPYYCVQTFIAIIFIYFAWKENLWIEIKSTELNTNDFYCFRSIRQSTSWTGIAKPAQPPSPCQPRDSQRAIAELCDGLEGGFGCIMYTRWLAVIEANDCWFLSIRFGRWSREMRCMCMCIQHCIVVNAINFDLETIN